MTRSDTSKPATKQVATKVAAKIAAMAAVEGAAEADGGGGEPPSYPASCGAARDVLQSSLDECRKKRKIAKGEKEALDLGKAINALVGAIAMLDSNESAFRDTLDADHPLEGPTPEQLKKAQELAQALARDITVNAEVVAIARIAKGLLSSWPAIGTQPKA